MAHPPGAIPLVVVVVVGVCRGAVVVVEPLESRSAVRRQERQRFFRYGDVHPVFGRSVGQRGGRAWPFTRARTRGLPGRESFELLVERTGDFGISQSR